MGGVNGAWYSGGMPATGDEIVVYEDVDVEANPLRVPSWLKWTLGVAGVLAAGTGVALVARKVWAKPSGEPSPSPSPSPSPEPAPAPAPAEPELLGPGTQPVYKGETYILDSGTNKSVKSILWDPITDGASADDLEWSWEADTSKLRITVLGPYGVETQMLDVHTFADEDQTEPIASWRLMMLDPRAS